MKTQSPVFEETTSTTSGLHFSQSVTAPFRELAQQGGEKKTELNKS